MYLFTIPFLSFTQLLFRLCNSSLSTRFLLRSLLWSVLFLFYLYLSSACLSPVLAFFSSFRFTCFSTLLVVTLSPISLSRLTFTCFFPFFPSVWAAFTGPCSLIRYTPLFSSCHLHLLHAFRVSLHYLGSSFYVQLFSINWSWIIIFFFSSIFLFVSTYNYFQVLAKYAFIRFLSFYTFCFSSLYFTSFSRSIFIFFCTFLLSFFCFQLFSVFFCGVSRDSLLLIACHYFFPWNISKVSFFLSVVLFTFDLSYCLRKGKLRLLAWFLLLFIYFSFLPYL